MSHPDRHNLLLLTPVVPAATGNGLAMRAGMQLQALSEIFDVRLVVVPVAGGSRDTAWAERHASSVGVVLPGDPVELRAGSMELFGDAVWRERLRRAEPLPHAAKSAAPGLARVVVEAAGGPQNTPVHALRAYLAPLAVAVAERVRAPWATLDLDDDDEYLFEQQGRYEEARAYRRILETFGPEFSWLSLASFEEANRVAERSGLRTTVVPNAVTVPAEAVGRSRRNAAVLTLLLVGNLTYGPNVDAAEILVTEMLPRVRRLVEREVRVELAGQFEPGDRVEALAAHDGVEVLGYVEDLDDAYARADLVVVPLREGAGTRIKLLEGFAVGVPVVATAVAASGLGAEHGRHLLLADDVQELAEAVARVALDEGLAEKLVRKARALVEERFSVSVVGQELRELVSSLR